MTFNLCSGPLSLAILQIVLNTGHQWVSQRIACPKDLRVCLFLPEEKLETAVSRAALPEDLSYQDVSFNIGMSGLLVSAMTTGDFEMLRYATQDRLHQSYRSKIKMNDGKDRADSSVLIEAALARGAYGGFISGKGPSVVALTGGGSGGKTGDTISQFLAEEVADGMKSAAAKVGIKGTVHITGFTDTGVQCRAVKGA